MFQRFLLAIDNSPSSEVALDFVTALSRQCSASVHVFHVNEYLVAGRGLTLLSRDEATELVGDAVAQLRDADIHASGSSTTGSYGQVARLIASTARDRSADAIVLGTSRHRNLQRLFSPRVRERTTRITDLPVLAAPSPLKISGSRKTSPIDLNTQIEEIARFLADTTHSA